MKVQTRTIGFYLAASLASLALVVASAPKNGAEAEKKPVLHGTIKVDGNHTDAELAKMAKISKADAEATALKALRGKPEDKKVSASELEVEDGYLVYSIEMTVRGQKGVEEILIDAGSGKILSREHESEGKESAEDEDKDKAEDDDAGDED